MTLALFDGFDFDDAVNVWTFAAAGSLSTTARTGPRSYLISAGSIARLYQTLSTTEEDDGVTVGFGISRGSGGNTSATDIFRLASDLGATVHIILNADPSNRILTVKRGDGTVLFATAANSWHYEDWAYFELKAKIADASGTVELKVNGATLGSFTGDTRNGGTDALIDRVQWGESAGAWSYLIDDVYILNEQGAGPDNTFLGDSRAYPHYPDGNGNYSQCTGSDGNQTDNYLLVDEQITPSSADYSGSATDGNIDTYTFENATPTTGTVYAVEARLFAAKSDAGGPKSIRAKLRRSATDVSGADQVLSTAYVTYRQLWITDPVAAAAWTITNFNATEFGFEVRP